MMKVFINGVNGRMGQAIAKLLETPFEFVGGSSAENPIDADLIDQSFVVDFSSQKGNQALLEYVQQHKPQIRGLLIGSTGLEESQLAQWRECGSEFPVLVAPNTSLGIFLLLKSALSVAGAFFDHGYDVVLEETHHRHKVDAPSGTAVMLGNELAASLRVKTHSDMTYQPGSIAMHASRGGGVFGEHRIRFLGEDDEVELVHRSRSRGLFAKGAVVLLRWLTQQTSGFSHVTQLQAEDLKSVIPSA